MYTQCPKCRTIFEIDEAALQAALGIVRCGQCSERFDALRTLSGELPAGPGAALLDHDPEQLTPVLTHAIAAPERSEHARRDEPAGEAPPPAAPAPPAPVDPPDARRPDAVAAASMDRATHALVAEVVDVPPDAVCGGSAWLPTALPEPPRLPHSDSVTCSPDASAAMPLAGSLAGAGTGAVAGPRDGSADPTADSGAALPEASAPLLLLEHRDPGPAPPGAADFPGADGTATAAPTSAPVEGAAPEAVDDATAAAADSVVPLYVSPRRPRIRRSSALFGLGCAVLVLALAAQIAWARRGALVRDPATQAWALGVCAKVDCRLPPIRDVGKLELLSRDVRADPGAAGALVISATIRNDASFRQPWPVVAVRLTDLDNNVIAMRRFRPAEYVPDRARRDAGIAAGATAAVVFEVADPGPRASGFRFALE